MNSAAKVHAIFRIWPQLSTVESWQQMFLLAVVGYGFDLGFTDWHDGSASDIYVWAVQYLLELCRDRSLSGGLGWRREYPVPYQHHPLLAYPNPTSTVPGGGGLLYCDGFYGLTTAQADALTAASWDDHWTHTKSGYAAGEYASVTSTGTTHTNTTIDGLDPNVVFLVGQDIGFSTIYVSGTGIPGTGYPSGTTVTGKLSSTSLSISAAATNSATETITFDVSWKDGWPGGGFQGLGPATAALDGTKITQYLDHGGDEYYYELRAAVSLAKTRGISGASAIATWLDGQFNTNLLTAFGGNLRASGGGPYSRWSIDP